MRAFIARLSPVLLCVLQCGVYLRTLAAQGTLVQCPMLYVLHLFVLLVFAQHKLLPYLPKVLFIMKASGFDDSVADQALKFILFLSGSTSKLVCTPRDSVGCLFGARVLHECDPILFLLLKPSCSLLLLRVHLCLLPLVPLGGFLRIGRSAARTEREAHVRVPEALNLRLHPSPLCSALFCRAL